ncbi:hypothetical protein K493DRAFT_257031 [Basidiobolus meristosporus CBS 931.73]|uniref:RING-type domain-containing protein n=1 Tax=Basidiobolus meristosporus CBS 931.73 TaxID=1314790 RepID=A0A1Y1YNU1_9FUNG|nr:hypothetical protein K493DRAFT_257031 [Basidiobolus meristosporus CBS 931.73]|eukprot:ORX99710.1 hypothetical protein K493DRAFT_257031 [Basidiobolus meristosporus CBS 931.73]
MSSSPDIEYWLQRCSICFDAQLDFCLDYCRDQYCRDCFKRYVKEVVNNSWGLSITKIKCPVCQDVLSQSEWSKYVDSETVELYNTYNRPYRAFTRFCPECEHEVRGAKMEPISYKADREKYFDEVHDLLNDFFQKTNYAALNTSEFLNKFRADYRNFLSGGSITVADMYKYTLEKMIDCLGLWYVWSNEGSKKNVPKSSKVKKRKLEGETDSLISAAAKISSKLVSLEFRPELWKELQFMHIANFPQVNCQKCYQEVCLRCGEGSHHKAMTCFEYMEDQVRNSHTYSESVENLKWKLENSKSCPNCCILINRDDGCNKVDCLHCGHRFCWICRDTWSEKCGFYQCRGAKNGPTSEIESPTTKAGSISEMPEIGVPNVIAIQAKLATPQRGSA